MKFRASGKHAEDVRIDRSDWVRVRKFRWHIIRSKHKPSLRYAATTLWNPKTKKQSKWLLHHFVLPGFPQLDHKNGNGLDCRKENLRPATQLQNLWNRPKTKNNTSGRKGVIANPKRRYNGKQNKRWIARITVLGKSIWLGVFDDIDEAAYAYDAAARKFFGDFARTNF